MKNVLLSLAFILGFSIATPAQTFRDKLNDFLSKPNVGGITPQQLSPIFESIKAGETENRELLELLDRYAEEQLLNDMTDVLAPYYENNMTTADLDKLTEMYSRTDVQQAIKHITTLSGSDFRAGMISDLQKPLLSVISGKNVENIPLKKSIDKKYAKLCKKYIDASGIEDILGSSKGLLSSVPALGNSGNLIDYLDDNMTTIITNHFYGRVSKDDLKVMTKVCKTKAYKHFNKGTEALMQDLMPVAMKMQSKVSDWVKKNK